MKRRVTIDDCCAFERLNGGDWHAGKDLVCWGSDHSDSVWVKELSTGSVRAYTAGGSGAGCPRFSPDGGRISFLSSLPGMGRQVCVAELEGGKITASSSISGAAMDPVWSPDGRYILFSSSQGSHAPAERSGSEPVVIEDFHYKVDGAGFIRPDGHVQLFLLDTLENTVRQLTSGPYDWMHHVWGPDGRTVAAAGNLHRPRAESIGFDLYIMDISAPSPSFRQISHDLTIVSYPNPVRPVFSADGRAVIAGVLSPDADPALGYPPIYLYRFPVDGGDARQLFFPDEGCYQCVQFPYNAFCGSGMDKMALDPDSGDIYFVSGWQGQGNLYRLPAGEGHAVPVRTGRRVIHGLSRVQGGKMMIAESLPDRPEAYLLLSSDEAEEAAVLVQSAESILSECMLSPAEDFFFETLDGESRVHGFVLPPARREEGRKVPAVVYIHGGPHPFYTYGFTVEFQCLASAGYAVLYCNPRGSSGYGPVHQNYARSVDGCAYTDILQFVDECLRRFPWIDGERLGVTGGSYGGYMTNWIASHARRFSAYITQRSVVSSLIGYASSDMQGSSSDFANYEEFMMDALKKSPVSYAEHIDRPLLILHGEDDLRCPVEGAHQLFTAVKDTHPDLPVRLVIFPKTAHDQPRIPALLKRYYQEMHTWFNTYLMGKPPDGG
ncbi:MAG: S9 family peptidase [Clostridiales bacterium]|nr:S9 family peptidase [Clostridiales bacterium]